MTDAGRIPIVVGVTGHRALRPEDRETLLGAVERELTKLRQQVPNSPLLLLTSLAEGADLLCADAARALGIPVAVALPMAAEDYALKSVHGGCDKENIASRRAMEKGGMLRCGTEENGDPLYRFHA